MSGTLINIVGSPKTLEETAADWPDYQVMLLADVPRSLMNGYRGSPKV
jgi:hypothetical protein